MSLKYILLALVGHIVVSFTQVHAQVNVQVGLSPAGSFEIEAPRVRGQVRADGNGGHQADQLRLAVSSMKTGIELRDEHLHDRLKSKEHPQIIVTNAKGSGGRGTADIEVAGVKRPISFNYREQGRQIEVTFDLNLKEFNISGISYMGVGVRDQIRVKAMVPVR